jgi:hypothetical protein
MSRPDWAQYARPWRDLAAVGHSAGLMFDTITGRADELVCDAAYIGTSSGPNGTTICWDRNTRPSVSCRIYGRRQSANAGPGLLLHDAVSTSPFFEMDIVPLGHVTDASFSPALHDRLQLFCASQVACLTTCRFVDVA